ncbi:MAG: hypothetical protein IKK62_05190 [Bacteroidaceae bacterium]|nr:hypothetical protein [Bacteroidaceae bacterium]
MQEALVIVIVLMAAAAAIYHLICSFRAMNGEENPCRHCASSCNCRLIQEEKEQKKGQKERKNMPPCKKRGEKSC